MFVFLQICFRTFFSFFGSGTADLQGVVLFNVLTAYLELAAFLWDFGVKYSEIVLFLGVGLALRLLPLLTETTLIGDLFLRFESLTTTDSFEDSVMASGALDNKSASSANVSCVSWKGLSASACPSFFLFVSISSSEVTLFVFEHLELALDNELANLLESDNLDNRLEDRVFGPVPSPGDSIADNNWNNHINNVITYTIH